MLHAREVRHGDQRRNEMREIDRARVERHAVADALKKFRKS